MRTLSTQSVTAYACGTHAYVVLADDMVRWFIFVVLAFYLPLLTCNGYVLMSMTSNLTIYGIMITVINTCVFFYQLIVLTVLPGLLNEEVGEQTF
jgi:hypothetical protein